MTVEKYRAAKDFGHGKWVLKQRAMYMCVMYLLAFVVHLEHVEYIMHCPLQNVIPAGY